LVYIVFNQNSITIHYVSAFHWLPLTTFSKASFVKQNLNSHASNVHKGIYLVFLPSNYLAKFHFDNSAMTITSFETFST